MADTELRENVKIEGRLSQSQKKNHWANRRIIDSKCESH